ncbi:MAG: hypothetical protein ACR2F8_04090 [Caulobacteraceae bacterium]
MRISPAGGLTWIVAAAAVGSLYAPALTGLSARATTPVAAGIIAAGLVGLALAEGSAFRAEAPESIARRLSAACLALAVALFAISQAAGAASRPMNLNDWGLFALQAGTPILLTVSGRRLALLRAFGWTCLAFAAVDAVANLAAFAHLIDLPAYAGRHVEGGVRLRYPGLSGATHAAGLVAFAAVTFVATGTGGRLRPALAARLGLLAVLIASLWLIDARRYVVLAILAVFLLGFRPAWRLPLAWIATGIGAAGVAAAFAEADDLRWRLMAAGAARALAHPLLGIGAAWRDAGQLSPVFQSLQDAGVTESGLVDLSIAYGALAAALLVLSALAALAARRARQSLPAVLLALLTAELAFGDSLTGFLGALLFFAALTACQRDDAALYRTAP